MNNFEWIPIENGTPKEVGWYLVSVDPYYMPPDGVELVDVAGWMDGRWWCDSYDGHKIIEEYPIEEVPIVAWMPLPKPYLVWDKEKQCSVRPE